MNSMKKTLLAAGAAMIVLGGAAYAAPGMMDREADMTLAQAKAKADEMFTRMDVNKDGKLDEADRAAKRAERFDRMDANSDGTISRDEFAARPERPDRGEMRGGERHADGERHHGKRGKRGGMMMMGKMADTNNDGAVSKAEFDAGVAKHFTMMDTDKDGTVTAAERKAAHEKMRETMKAMRAAKNAG